MLFMRVHFPLLLFSTLITTPFINPQTTQFIRTYNGSNNNLANPTWGTSNTPYLRLFPAIFSDNVEQPGGGDRPSAREISEKVMGRLDAVSGESGFNALLVFFGQVVVFDTVRSIPNISDPFPIPVPTCDSEYDASCTGNKTIPFNRQSSTMVNGQRIGTNYASSFLDASFLYGTSESTVNSLRTGNGGLMRMSSDGLPEQVNGSMVVGDPRFTNNPGVQVIYTLLLREHNRRANILRKRNLLWSDEELFQGARKWVIGIWQKFVFTQYVPTLIGGPLPEYKGYNSSINPGTDAFFMACSMRYGHSVVPNHITLIGDNGLPLQPSPLTLNDQLFSTNPIRRYGIEPILRGLVSQKEGAMDTLVTKELRKLSATGAFDVPAFNIQRGRDVGLPSYNQARQYFGLKTAEYFSDITSNIELQEVLNHTYGGNISRIDAWVGAIAEDHYQSSRVGTLMRESIHQTFLRLRDGDRLYYKNPDSGYNPTEITEIERFGFKELVLRNTNITKFPSVHFAFASNPPIAFTNATNPTGCGDQQNPLITLADGYTLNWTVTDDIITFETSFSYNGWFAIGFGPAMTQMDINVVVPTAKGEVNVLDYWSTFYDPKPDTEIGGADIFNVVRISPKDSLPLRVRWSRRLDTKDPKDVALTRNDMTLRFAYSKSANVVGYHGPMKGSVVVNFYSACPSPVSAVDAFATSMRISVRLLHGTTLLICFGILYPIGIFVARHRNTIDPNWLKKHERLMSLGSSEVMLAVLAGIVTRQTQFIHTHSKLGLSVFVCVILSFIFGNLSKSPTPRFRKFHKYIRKFHLTFGSTTAIVGLVNCGYGIDRLSVEIPQAVYLQYIYYAWVGIVVITFAVAELRKSTKKRVTEPKEKRQEHDVMKTAISKAVPTFSWEEFNNRVTEGSLWVVINQCIYSVNSFVNMHPGGAEIIFSRVGTDVTQFFYDQIKHDEFTGVIADTPLKKRFMSHDGRSLGESPKSGHEGLKSRRRTSGTSTKTHMHSRLARVKLRGFLVGILKDDTSESKLDHTIEIRPTCVPKAKEPPLSSTQFRAFIISSKTLVAGEPGDSVYKITIDFQSPEDEIWFIPGDYVQIQLTTSDGHTICRPYTPIKTYNKGNLELIIKTYSNGQLTSRIKSLEPGDEVTVRGPLHGGQLLNIENTNIGCFGTYFL
ncbi:heme peroxidase [Paraphysoderma sedebokerense]|nr:heme peroxidase [Paraphysoderma sedebokerense]